jgi:hypothetical protein
MSGAQLLTARKLTLADDALPAFGQDNRVRTHDRHKCDFGVRRP